MGTFFSTTSCPGGRDAGPIERRLREELAALAPAERERLEDRLAAYRRVAAGIHQRHQAERNPWKYAVRLAHDTVWPPFRVWRIFWSWSVAPARAAALARRHRPQARFILTGHTHRPGVWRKRSGVVAINTGSFCRPFGGYAVDLVDGELVVRRIEARDGRFHPGAVMARFALEGS